MSTAVAAATIAPGLYPGMSYLEYSKLPAINHSKLKHFSRSAAHARYEMLHEPDPTRALDFGIAFHVAVLEPERFATEYVVVPKVDKRTNIGKATWAEFEELHRGKTMLTQDEHEKLLAMAGAVQSNPLAAELVGGAGRNELSAVWQDEQTQLLCKLRLDRFTQVYGYPCVVDLKTTVDASPREFSRSIAEYGYHEQAAFYLDGLAALAPGDRRFVHVAVEKEEPFAVACYELEQDAIDEGRKAYRRHLKAYAACLATNNWPGYPVGLLPVSLPAWAFSFSVD